MAQPPFSKRELLKTVAAPAPQEAPTRLVECYDCGHGRSRSALWCPRCGRPNLWRMQMVIGSGVLIALFVMLFLSCFISLLLPNLWTMR